MRGTDQKSPAEFSDFEIPISVDPESGQAEMAARERRVANVRLLWENRWFFTRIFGIGLLLSTIIAFLIPKRYESTARLMPPDSQSTSGLAMAAATFAGAMPVGLGGLAGDLLGQKSSSDLIVGVLGSRTVEDKLIQKFDLTNVYHSKRLDATRKRLEEFTEISIDRKSQIIAIKVTDTDPQRAAALTQAYVEELNRTLAGVSTSSGRRERIFLEERLKTVGSDLEAAEKQFGQFASKNTAIDIKEQGKSMVEAAAALQEQLVAARSELGELRQLYTDGNVRVRAAQARIAALEIEIQKVSGAEDTPQKAADVDSMYPSIRQLPLLGVPYADLYRKIKVQEALFELLTQKYELAKVQEAKETPTVTELDIPKPPERKSYPPRLMLMLLGSMLSLVGGACWVFGRKKWEQADPASPEKMLAHEVFKSVRSVLPGVLRNRQGLSSDGCSAQGARDDKVDRDIRK